jgi:hypothetical protein
LEDRTLLSASLLFDPAAGSLSILGDSADTTIRQSFNSAGFLEVAVDGQTHSSNPASPFFDQALAGAGAGTLTGIQFDGGSGHDTLVLAWDGFQNRPTGDFTVSATGADVVSQDLAVAGDLTIQAQNIRMDGAVHASAIDLAASDFVTIEAKGLLAANQIDVSAGVFVNSGQLHADGQIGGQIFVSAGNVLNAGQISADGSTAGGAVQIAFTGSYVDTSAAVTSADGGKIKPTEPAVLAAGGNLASAPGGTITIDGGATGHLFSSGTFHSTGSTGGIVGLFAQDIELVAASLDVSGDSGSGIIYIGADNVGQISNLPGGEINLQNLPHANAQTVTVTAATTLHADARIVGPGGRVIVWSDQATQFDGFVSARGGPAGGDGGLVEISGKGNLNYGGAADTSSPLGKPGTLLLDPKNLVIDAVAGVMPQFNLVDPHPTTGTHFGQFVTVLSGGNVVVANPNDNFGGTNAGAAYLFNGLTGALISSLVGSAASDQVGGIIQILSNGNYLVRSPIWHSSRGAVTWASSTAGVSGTVSDANSLVGSNPNDQVGSDHTIPDSGVATLSNGNYVVQSPFWNGNRGAVTWGSGAAGVSGVVSDTNSLVGSNANDKVGSNALVQLSNGNYVVSSPNWNGNFGAVTWADGTMGVSGVLSDSNSLVGSSPNDQVGSDITHKLSNGNFLVLSPLWNGNRGAVTWGSGTTGVTGILSDANSLVGSNPNDRVGFNIISNITLLTNANYVVSSPSWNGGRGAATWGDGTMGVSGFISDANSLVGSNPGDQVSSTRIVALTNGNYVVISKNWNSARGAVTWGSGTSGVTGTISADNSLVGSNPNDSIGGPYMLSTHAPPSGGGVTPLTNGNYVVWSPNWNGNRGAATWGSGTTGITGVVSESNSLVGSSDGDHVGGFQYVIPLTNGNYVVSSPSWNGGRGAATWGNGTAGVTGAVSAANSLVGSSDNDQVGGGPLFTGGVVALTNGNYVVLSPSWNRMGAATWGSGTSGVSGVLSATNSLVGSSAGDAVGYALRILTNGNFVIASPFWNGNRGAVTWGSSATGITGVVSEANSLVGANPNDWVGASPPLPPPVIGLMLHIVVLSNGNYLVGSPSWNGNRGAVTWGSGTGGVTGAVSADNSLIGDVANEFVGGITTLSNGNYVVSTSSWNGNRGAVTWGSGTAGVTGTVSADNSLVGSSPNDKLGLQIFSLSNGDYVVWTPNWNGNRSAATWASGASGQTLDGQRIVTPQNSLVAQVADAGLGVLGLVFEDVINQSLVVGFATEGSGRLAVGLLDPNQLAYARGQSQTITITPALLTRTLNTGGAVILQASNDITINSAITVSAGGNGGALTLQAGRSILINASISTDNGNLTLIANDSLANGVVDSQRDPGAAVITMASGATLNTGTGALTIELRDGAGKTYADSGAITLQSLTAGTLSVTNNGPSAGSDVVLAVVTTTGAQTYASPNGTTIVTDNLTTADNPVTFNTSVILNAGLTLSVGAGTVTFAGGTVTPNPGNFSIAGGMALASSTTFTAILNGTDQASYSQVTATGPVDLGSSTLTLTLGFTPNVGDSFTLLTAGDGSSITGMFAGLDEGATFSQDGITTFQITYQGGPTGNSVVLTRVS